MIEKMCLFIELKNGWNFLAQRMFVVTKEYVPIILKKNVLKKYIHDVFYGRMLYQQLILETFHHLKIGWKRMRYLTIVRKNKIYKI